MGWRDRFRRTPKSTSGTYDRGASREDHRHLENFVATRVGVEAYVEPQTNVTALTVLLVATDGEWTRRRIGSEAAARKLSTELKIPVYDVQRTGYPQRMRDWSSRHKDTP